MILKKLIKHAAAIVISVFAICITANVDTVKADVWNGLGMDEGGNWHYYTDGQINTGYTGMACNDYGWWYVVNGCIAWNYTGYITDEYGVWTVINGYAFM